LGQKRRTAAQGHDADSGVAVFPKEIVTPGAKVDGSELHEYPGTGAEMPKGGHFAAFEQP
jgi:hypothetical protein